MEKNNLSKQWVKRIREVLHSVKRKQQREHKRTDKTKSKTNQLEHAAKANGNNSPQITHGLVIVDRKNVFQCHAAEVHSVDDVKAVLAKLKSNKKNQNAKHNVMYAYRIEQKTAKSTRILQEYDEDGETHAAGGGMFHLLEVLGVKNTVVIVRRDE